MQSTSMQSEPHVKYSLLECMTRDAQVNMEEIDKDDDAPAPTY